MCTNLLVLNQTSKFNIKKSREVHIYDIIPIVLQNKIKKIYKYVFRLREVHVIPSSL